MSSVTSYGLGKAQKPRDSTNLGHIERQGTIDSANLKGTDVKENMGLARPAAYALDVIISTLLTIGID